MPRKTSLSIKSSFDAAHHLPGHSGKCANVHGHTWNVEAVVSGVYKRKNGIHYILDFKDFKEMLNNILNVFDHKDLNSMIECPTAEVIANRIFDNLEGIIANYAHREGIELTLEKVVVSESPTSSAIVEVCNG